MLDATVHGMLLAVVLAEQNCSYSCYLVLCCFLLVFVVIAVFGGVSWFFAAAGSSITTSPSENVVYNLFHYCCQFDGGFISLRIPSLRLYYSLAASLLSLTLLLTCFNACNYLSNHFRKINFE